MIKKPSLYQPYPTKNTVSYLKSEHNNQNVSHKKMSSNTVPFSHTLTSKSSLQQKPLRQITNELSLANKQPKKDYQKCLKSQNSITDLSEIVAIELSSAEKKESYIQNIQTYEKPLSRNLQSNDNFYMRKEHQQIYLPELEQNSLGLDDFQILDIYQATAIKNTHQQIDKVSDLRNRRKSGGIRKNSRVLSKQSDQIQKKGLSPDNSECNRLNFNDNEQIGKLSSRSQSQQHTRRSSVDISKILDDDIRKCGQKLFNSICQNKKYIVETDLQKAKLSCQMRLILGPIVTRLKQKKYSELNLSSFAKEFATIMKDFSPKQCLEIVKKIQQNKCMELNPQNSYQQSESIYFNENPTLTYKPRSQPKLREPKLLSMKEPPINYPPNKIQHRQVENNAQQRLQKLTSKVDLFLSKISSQYFSKCQVMDKHKVPTLMSRLTEIEELSGDSEDFGSKRDSIPNEFTETDQITKDVYVDISERKIAQEEQGDSQSNYVEGLGVSSGLDERDLQQKQRYERDEFLFQQQLPYSRASNPFKKQVIYPPYECFSSAESTKRKLFNQTQSVNRERNSSNKRIYERLFPESSPESTSRISFKTVNLQFSELAKYLY